MQTGAAGDVCAPEVLLSRCRGGDRQAWNTLVDTFTPLVWTVARSMRLSATECEDVCQATWERVVAGIGGIRDGGKLPQWLVTVAKREALRYRMRTRRTVPFGDLDAGDLEPWDGQTIPGPEDDVLRQVPRAAVLRAVAALPARHQALVSLLVADPPMCYDEISVALGIPRGSIGPTRSRIFAQLREMLGDEV